MFPE
jgi:hypothetical protein